MTKTSKGTKATLPPEDPADEVGGMNTEPTPIAGIDNSWRLLHRNGNFNCIAFLHVTVVVNLAHTLISPSKTLQVSLIRSLAFYARRIEKLLKARMSSWLLGELA